MTGQQLYELSAKGYKHDPWNKLSEELRKFYEEEASHRHRMYYLSKGKPLQQEKQSCCGGCSGHCDEPND